MKACRRFFLVSAVLCSALACAGVPAPAHSEVSVNVNIGPPPVLVEPPPELVVVPRTMVYYAPGADAEIFFYRGRWWTRHEGHWFRARAYNGPWVTVGPRYVPVDIVRLPRDYRTLYVHEKHVPYGQLKKHWERREYEKRKHQGEWKEGKRERKEEKREWKEEQKERKKDNKKGKKHGGKHGD